MKNIPTERDIQLVTTWIKGGSRQGPKMIKELINGTFNANNYLR